MLRHLAGKPLRQSLKKLWYPRSGLCGKPDTDRFVLFVPINTRFEIFQHIDLVHHQQGWDLVSVDLFKNRIHRFDVFLYTHIRRINDVQQ